MKWAIILSLLSFAVVTMAVMDNSDQKTTRKLTNNPKTFNSKHEIIVLVDVKIDKEGKAQTVKLSQPKRYTSFNQLALLAAKKRHYDKKEVDGVFVEYWLKNVEIKHTVSPMGTPIQPIQPKLQ
jgi:hypothetical protein